jgi:AAA domain
MNMNPVLDSPLEESKESPQQTASKHSELNPLRLRELQLHTPDAVDDLCTKDSKKGFVVEGLIARGSLNLAAGDSGLGKSPLFYQLGLCVAAGLPWLSIPTVKGRVIYIDLENGVRQSQQIRNNLVKFLGLEECPSDFLTHYGGHALEIKCLVDEVHPSLVLVDTLRAYQPDFEQDNTRAGKLLKEFRSIAHERDVAFQFIHHVRKPGEHGVPALEDTLSPQWLNQACGARALINQTDFRLGIDCAVGSSRRFLGVKHPNIAEETAIVLRGHVRVRGEFGPIFLARCFDDEGQPIGYRMLSGVELLCNTDQQQAFAKLPDSFTFKEAKLVYGRQDQATSDFLEKCIRLDILSRKGKGQYEKKIAKYTAE